VADIWAKFQALLPTSTELVGTVTAIHTNGTCSVELPGGGGLRVDGTGVAEGKKAFIKDGIIQREAPNLPYYDLEV